MTAKQKEWVLQNFDDYPWSKLKVLFEEKFGIERSITVMRKLVKKNGLEKTSEKNKIHRCTYTMEQKQFIVERSLKTPRAELTLLFNEKFGTNKTVQQIKNYLNTLKEQNFPVNDFQRKNEEIVNNDEMKNWIFKNAPKYYKAKLYKEFNEHFKTNYGDHVFQLAIDKLGITNFAPDERIYPKEVAKIIINESTNLSDRMIADLIEKKTNRKINPHQISRKRIKLGLKKEFKCIRNSSLKYPIVYPIGYEKMTTRGLQMKLGNCNWVSKKRYVWEQHYGKLKPDENIINIDGNPYNCDISNLAKISELERNMMNAHKLYGKGIVTQAGLEVIKTEVVVKNLENNSNNTKELN